MSRPNFPSVILALCLTLAACGSTEDEGTEGGTAVSPTAATTVVPPVTTQAEQGNCSSPVTGGEDASAVLGRFGNDARAEELPGAEGATMPGLVLWGSDPARRVEVLLSEDKQAKVVGWRIGEGARRTVQGIAVGDPVSKLAAVNGSPFRFYGFSWDYGGYVTDWEGGSLDDLPGGCTLSVRLSPANDDLPAAIMGEAEISSDNPLVAHSNAVVSEISVSFGDKD